MEQIQTFTSEEFGSVRTTMINDEPWFVGKDVADILGYSKSRNAIALHVDEDDALKQGLTDSLGRVQETIIINESGLYSLILSSKLPTAKKFKRWVTSEVLPSIRKHGAYATPVTIENIINNPDFGIELLQTLKNEQKKNKELTAQNEVMKPKALFADAVASSSTSILIGQLAKILTQNGYKTGQNRLFAKLREEGYLSSRKGKDWNMPQQRYVDQGLFEIKESTHIDSNGVNIMTKTVVVTGKGQVYFINKFIKEAKRCQRT